MNKRKLLISALVLFIIIPCIIVALVFFVKKNEDSKYMLKDYSSTKDLDILVLGNWFFISSDFEKTFNMVLEENGKTDVNVDYLALPYYQTSFFYSDIYIMEESREEYTKLRNGEYDIVVLSAFYTQEDEPAVGDFVKELTDTGTEIILLPAENAATSLVTNAMITYDVCIANWQKSLQNLKNNHGFTVQNLNGNDSIPMSNQLGGFNGACLLYARLYRGVPKIDRSSQYIIDEFGDKIPGRSKAEKEDKLYLIATEAYDDIRSEDRHYIKLKK